MQDLIAKEGGGGGGGIRYNNKILQKDLLSEYSFPPLPSYYHMFGLYFLLKKRLL